MPEDWKRPEASGVKRRVVIWLTEAPFSGTVLINVTNQHNEDSSCFPHCIYQRGEGGRGEWINRTRWKSQDGGVVSGQCNALQWMHHLEVLGMAIIA